MKVLQSSTLLKYYKCTIVILSIIYYFTTKSLEHLHPIHLSQRSTTQQ